MPFLVDTNIVSEVGRPRPHHAVEQWLGGEGRLFVSAITIEEIMFGFAWHPNPSLKLVIDRFLGERTETIPVTHTIAARAGELRGRFLARGIVRDPADMLIAATAAEHGLTLATRNVKHFDGTAIRTFNPFS